MAEKKEVDPVPIFMGIGLAEPKAKETLNNKHLTATLLTLLEEVGATGGVDKSIGLLYYYIATKLPKKHEPRWRILLGQYVKDGKMKTVQQLEYAIKFLEAHVHDPSWKTEDLEKAAGVESVVNKLVSEVMEKHKAELIDERYSFIPAILKELNQYDELTWADGKVTKSKVEEAALKMLGPKTADDETPRPKKKSASKDVTPKTATPKEEKKEELAPTIEFSKPEDNTLNPPKVLAAHLKATGGKVMTRFPPEPNGHLHIGHAKAMFLDFGHAKKHGGKTILRFDDTNPEAEKLEYIQNIQDIVKWMGHEPCAVTFASQYYQEMFDYAVQLIKSGKAFVCHQTADEMSKSRENKTPSPWRDRPIEENLREFYRMKNGEYEEGAAVLRMKMNYKSENPCMHDLVAYRIKFTAHPMAGDKWCIYPSYDFEHCIIDSIENITHSLCTLEFEVRRESYYWLLDALGIYKAVVWEFSRLNLTHTIMSKRKLHRLVHEKICDGWDDPRLPTLIGMKRRGYSPKAINAFCDAIGVSRTENLIKMELLEHCVRTDMDQSAIRAFCVVNPLKVIIDNWDESKRVEISAPNHPKDAARGTRMMPLTRVLYIEKDDFRMVDNKNYFGLAPNKTVLLRYAFRIKCKSVVTDAKGEPIEIHVEAITDEIKEKQQGVIHWVAEPYPGKAPLKVECRLYGWLFKTEDISEVENYLTDLSPESRVIVSGYGEPILAELEPETPVQFERVGFFVPDKDTTKTNPVYNRTVTLREAKDIKDL